MTRLATGRSTGPRLDYPATVDFGEQERGQIAVAHVTLANTGDSELLISNIRSNCSCAGLERQNGSTFERIENLRLAPDQRSQVVVRWAVNGLDGEARRNVVYLTTNVPQQPEVALTLVVARIRGGLETHPQAVAFGRVTAGSVVRHVVDIVDRASEPRKIGRVTASGPGVKVRLLPTASDLWDGPGGGFVAGRIEVEVDTSAPARVDGRVDAWVQAERAMSPISFAVAGQVVDLVEVTPKTVTLPRMSDGGPLYNVVCLCYSPDNTPFSLRTDVVPPGCKVTVREAPQPGAARRVEIEFLAEGVGAPRQMTEPLMVRLVAQTKGQVVPLEVTVSIRPKE